MNGRIRSSFKRYEMYALVAGCTFIVGVSIGVLIPIQSPITYIPNQYEIGGSYHFINPLLMCGDNSFSVVQDGELRTLQDSINNYFSSEKSKGDIDGVSLYFRELNGGQYISINPDFQFVPASLLKVPLAMSVYLENEKQPGLVNEKVFFPIGSSPASEYFTAPTITASTTYSVEDLIDAMLINSDNSAALLLTHVISTADLNSSYSNLGITAPTNDIYTMTTAQYAAFFRILYNATYLSHDDSEHVLKLLSQSVFRQGIVAGVPANITVAHKFGERGFNSEAPNQLHDCGIVYARHPYLICIATQGQDYDAMVGVIAAVSKMVYAYAGP